MKWNLLLNQNLALRNVVYTVIQSSGTNWKGELEDCTIMGSQVHAADLVHKSIVV